MWNVEQNLLPIRLQPEPDELFSSWLMRLAMAHFLKLHTFTRFIFSKQMIWSNDIDNSLGDVQIEKMRLCTALPSERILATALRGYEGKMYEDHKATTTVVPWLMPLMIYRFKRTGFGLQMCPQCLSEDKTPYFRRIWRVAWATVCLRHKTVLLDRCPGCQNSIMFHRGDLGSPIQAVSHSMTQCSVCDLNWTSVKVLESLTRADESILVVQGKLENVLNDGWGEISGLGMVHSIPYFNGFRHLVKLLSVNRESQKFREIASRESGINLISERPRSTKFEHLSTDERNRTLQAANWLLENWDEKFVPIAESSNTLSTILNPTNKDLPFWLTSVVDNHLARKNYSPSDMEIHSAISYLEKREKLFSIFDLQKLVGCRVSSNRTDKLRLSIYQRLVKSNEAIEKRRVQAVRREAGRILRNSDGLPYRVAKKMGKQYAEQNIKPPAGFIKSQKQYKKLIEIFQVRIRLNMIRRMEEVRNIEIVKAEFGMSRSNINKWRLQYKRHGKAGLSTGSHIPPKFHNQIVFEEQREWIRTLHAEGMILTEIRAELANRFNFQISQPGLYDVMRKMDLPLPFAQKWKFGNKTAQASLTQKGTSPRRIFAEQEKWIRDIHAEGLNYSQITLELKRRHDFTISSASLREYLIKNSLYSPRSIVKSKRIKRKSAGN